jgi:hypothetical protein
MNTKHISALKKIAKKSTYPIIDKTVYLNGYANKITATDLSTWLSVPIPDTWTVYGQGVISISHLDTLKKCSQVMIDFNDTKGRAKIVTDARNVSTVEAQSAEDYPEPPGTIEHNNAGWLAGGQIAGVLDFLGKDWMYRPELTGAYIGPDICGTNGHILRWSKNDLYSGQPFVMERAAVEVIKTLLDKKSDNFWKIRQGPESVLLMQGDIFINTMPINETYPNFKNVIPEYPSPGTFTLDRVETIKTLADLSTVVNKETGALALSFTDNNVQIKVEDLDTGSKAIRNLDSHTTYLAGSGYRIGFNDKYLKTVASSVDSQALAFQVSQDNPNRAAVINNEILLMPVMLPTLAETVEAYG